MLIKLKNYGSSREFFPPLQDKKNIGTRTFSLFEYNISLFGIIEDRVYIYLDDLLMTDDFFSFYSTSPFRIRLMLENLRGDLI